MFARLRRWLAIGFMVAACSAAIVLAVEATTALAYGWSEREYLARLGPDTLLLSTGLVAVLVAGLFGLTGRLRWAIPLAAMAGVLVVAVNMVKVRFRGEPLYPSDFGYVGEAELLISSVGVWTALAALGALVLVGVGAWAGVLLLGRLLRIPPAAGTDVPRWVWALRAGAVLAAVGTCVLVAGFHDQGNVVKRVYERAGAGWINWSQNENYRVNGFVGGFLYNMPAAPMARPEGYSREAVLEVAGRYVDKARAINEHRDADALTDTNIVIILGESFMDPLRLEGLELGEDPIPFTRALMDETMSGTMRTVAFGGGTANVEFEVMTGMASGLFSHTLPPYQGLVSSADHFPSLIDRFNDAWTTIGIHPFVADFYRRGYAYRAFGFDESRFIDQMRTQTKLAEAGYVSDAAAYTDLLEDLRTHEDPVLAKVVTMQNHAGYAGLYPDPIPVLEPASARDSWGLSDYLRGLSHADAALADLLAGLEALDEETVVLFYGDHAPPGVIPDDLWDAQPGTTARYETPWFVWSTQGVHASRHQGLLSPNQLWNQVLRATDAPLSGWDALVLELEGHPPTTALPADLERDLTLLQYDLALGNGWATDFVLAVPEP